jgi:hypothetical protein
VHVHADETIWRVFEQATGGKDGHRWWLWVFITEDTAVFRMDPARFSAVLGMSFVPRPVYSAGSWLPGVRIRWSHVMQLHHYGMLIFVATASAHVQLGDVGTWVAGVATALAFFATLFLLLISRQEQKAMRDEYRRAQARQVSAWCENVVPAADDGFSTVTVMIENSSGEPIYGMRVAIGTAWSREKIPFAEVKDLNYVTPPKYRKKHTVRLKLTPLPGGGYERSLPVELVFNDASGGRFWRRDRYGGLTQLAERVPSGAAKHLFTVPANLL